MDIRYLLQIIKKRWLLIFSLSTIFGVCSAFISIYYIHNIYESSATMIINSPKEKMQMDQLTLNDYTLNVKLVNSYRVLCKAEKILSQVIDETGLSLSIKQLSSKITVSPENDTEIIRISAQDEDPVIASQIANAVATVFVKEIPEIMRMDNVQIIDYANIATDPVKPNRPMIITITALIGILIGIGLSILIDYLDVSVRSTEQLNKLMGIPVLGSIPHIHERN